jgi:hypothetical protein
MVAAICGIEKMQNPDAALQIRFAPAQFAVSQNAK